MAEISASGVPIAVKRSAGSKESTIILRIKMDFSELARLVEEHLTVETRKPRSVVHVPIVAYVSE